MGKKIIAFYNLKILKMFSILTFLRLGRRQEILDSPQLLVNESYIWPQTMVSSLYLYSQTSLDILHCQKIGHQILVIYV